MVAGMIILIGAFGWVFFRGSRYESTDNSYVQAARVPVSTSVTGRIVEIRVSENQTVAAGQVLLILERSGLAADAREFEAALGSARARVAQMKAEYAANAAAVREAQDSLAFARIQAAREQALLKEGLSAAQQVETAEQKTDDALRSVERARDALAGTLAALGGDAGVAVDDHPLVREARARLDRALLALSYTNVGSPQAGIVTHVDQAQVGLFVTAGQPLFWLVGSTPWIEANFKEDQLENIRVGQSAEVRIDAYPHARFHARVASFSPGTGAVFSPIPAQNATGNWVKVVQRLPVRLVLIDPPAGLTIRSGMSARVTIDTRSGGNAQTAHR